LTGLPLAGLLALAVLAVALLTSTSPAPAQAQHFIDHYMCYPITASPSAPNKTVTLADQFETREGILVGAAKNLCAPALKNDEGSIIDAADHLKCYAIKESPAFAGRNVTINDQFGTASMRVGAAVSLCAPSLKSLTPPPPFGDIGLDHYKCYAAKQTSPKFPFTRVSVQDQFGLQRLVLSTPTRLCTPVAKNGAGIANQRDHLVGYPADIRVFTRNQFGTETVRGATGRMLLVPAFKTLQPARRGARRR
jgi:hypothetical protein